MAKRTISNDTSETVVPFLEEGSLEPEADETSFDDEDPLSKKKKKAKKRAATKAASVAADADDDEELTQTDALADADETPDAAAEEPTKRTRRSPKTEKRTVLVAEESARPEPAPAPATPPALSAEDLLKTMTAAFEKTTTSLREIPVEIATSLEQARDEAELRSSFVSKLTLGLSAAACVLSLLAVGLAQSTRHRQLQVEAATQRPATEMPTFHARSESRIEPRSTVERSERVDHKDVHNGARKEPRAAQRPLRKDERTEAMLAARAAATGAGARKASAVAPSVAVDPNAARNAGASELALGARRGSKRAPRRAATPKDF
jgi:hypothetical protein